MKRSKQQGYGKDIPPEKHHVLIWFLQKESTEIIALAFFQYYSAQKWKNLKGIPIKDWKAHAWAWIWDNKPIRSG